MQAENQMFINHVMKTIEVPLGNLQARWSDEKEYEDIKDYRIAIQKELGVFCVVESMTKKPFGFKTSLGTTQFHFFVKLYPNAYSICVKLKMVGA